MRPRDISSDNIVPSDRIANADIDYIGAGDTAVSGKKGWYSKLPRPSRLFGADKFVSIFGL